MAEQIKVDKTGAGNFVKLVNKTMAMTDGNRIEISISALMMYGYSVNHLISLLQLSGYKTRLLDTGLVVSCVDD